MTEEEYLRLRRMINAHNQASVYHMIRTEGTSGSAEWLMKDNRYKRWKAAPGSLCGLLLDRKFRSRLSTLFEKLAL
jgi:hypothetical protein